MQRSPYKPQAPSRPHQQYGGKPVARPLLMPQSLNPADEDSWDSE